jgi:hypothetical protein
MAKTNKPNNKYNAILILILTSLYIILITKISDIYTSNNDSDIVNDSYTKTSLSNYATTIYLISIIGLAVAYIMISSKSRHGYIIKNSITFGSSILLLYIMINYWEMLGEYTKLSLIVLLILSILYYIYE